MAGGRQFSRRLLDYQTKKFGGHSEKNVERWWPVSFMTVLKENAVTGEQILKRPFPQQRQTPVAAVWLS